MTTFENGVVVVIVIIPVDMTTRVVSTLPITHKTCTLVTLLDNLASHTKFQLIVSTACHLELPLALL